ncbi:Aste57867_13670 [Aphanomyces stellatus]|uniref:Aste57867_13670 protein n=1 Tax=Aphanomyces stellatus TaxID=120398 RepID=A0A485KYZ9_9STRA|nr:hypothetical protein As57867_013620 [Aphanomyces stellatus]VFT90504.1 Aste57867_13670 [Aphanomyces stellatus]
MLMHRPARLIARVGSPTPLCHAAPIHSWNAKKPTLVYKDTPSNASLLRQCPSLSVESYAPTWYLVNGFMHTIKSVRGSRNPKVHYERQLFHMSDGGLVSVDWTDAIPQDASNRPTLLIHPGAGGSSRDAYVRETATAMAAHGWRVAAFNARGCGNTPFTTARPPDGGFTQDVREVIAHMRANVVASAPLVAVGFSIGANLVVKYAGEEGAACPLTAVVSVSNPYDVAAVVQSMHMSFMRRKLLGETTAKAMLRQFFKNPKNVAAFASSPLYDLESLRQAKTSREVDDRLSRIPGGYATVDEYYNAISSAPYLNHVHVPHLSISALDDPLTTLVEIPTTPFRQQDQRILALTHTGGHLGFYTNNDGPKGGAPTMWTTRVIQEYCAAVIAT